MTLAFLVLGSVAIGYITIDRAQTAGPLPVWAWIVLPWVSVGLSAGVNYLLNMEGLICVIFALLLAPLERRLSPPVDHRTVETEIRIHAPASVVWRNIERVPAIRPEELNPTWTHRIGFPRPIEATLSHEGTGGVRHASFEHGLLFIETVTEWEPEHVLGFSIRADTRNIPKTTLDEHVTIGGRYFDVLHGEYRIEPLPNGEVDLQLSSEERLSTDFNGYAGMWSDAVMASLQQSILEVIRQRCEDQAAPREGAAAQR
jgi:hypothetical protein